MSRAFLEPIQLLKQVFNPAATVSAATIVALAER
jgi:hypothetical protein